MMPQKDQPTKRPAERIYVDQSKSKKQQKVEALVFSLVLFGSEHWGCGNRLWWLEKDAGPLPEDYLLLLQDLNHLFPSVIEV